MILESMWGVFDESKMHMLGVNMHEHFRWEEHKSDLNWKFFYNSF